MVLFLLTGPLTMRPHFFLLVPSSFYLHTLTSLLLFVHSRLIPPSSFCTCCFHASVPKYASDLLSTAFRFLLNRHVISESFSEQVIEKQIYNSKSPLPQHSFIRVYFAPYHLLTSGILSIYFSVYGHSSPKDISSRNAEICNSV